mgnify:FL=1
MAEMTIKLRVNPVTGRYEVKVDLESDADALPFEHEELHRRVVSKLLQSGLLPAGENPEVVITRGGTAVDAPSSSTSQQEARRASAAEG